MEQEVETALGEDIRRRDEMYYQLADVLDVKAGVILAVDAFLAALSGQILLVNDLPVAIKGIEVVAVLALSAALALGVISLWPRDFDIPPKPEQWSAHYQKLLKSYEADVSKAKEQFEKDRKTRILDRIAKNSGLTDAKAKLNKKAFYGTALAILLNWFALLWLAYWHIWRSGR
jgi:hypothetical protein